MKSLKNNFTGSLFRALGFQSIIILSMFTSSGFTQQNWAINASVAFNTGQYIYEQRTDNYYLNTGIRYDGNNWSASVSVPLILQNSAVYDPKGQTSYSNENQMMDQASPHSPNNFSGGIGDVYFYGEYRLPSPGINLPSVAVNAQIKMPTVNRLTLFSTGEFDYGLGVILRKWFGTYNGFADFGYLQIGDPQEITYLNPLGYGLGLSKFFSAGKYSASLYFKSYTEIIQGVNPPRQLSLGLFSVLSPKAIFSFYLIKGFSESSPDFALSSGIDWKL